MCVWPAVIQDCGFVQPSNKDHEEEPEDAWRERGKDCGNTLNTLNFNAMSYDWCCSHVCVVIFAEFPSFLLWRGLNLRFNQLNLRRWVLL